ncbi:MAG TPA: hypothetical protein VK524_27070, partial [Polyangiaceae bacterium]|nr:hypothetical protein [Polyangiaceae bacterium]
MLLFAVSCAFAGCSGTSVGGAGGASGSAGAGGTPSVPAYSLRVDTPRAGSTVRGVVVVGGFAPGFVNVEVWDAAHRSPPLARTAPRSDGAFIVTIDTASLASGPSTWTIWAWDSAPGQAFTRSANSDVALTIERTSSGTGGTAGTGGAGGAGGSPGTCTRRGAPGHVAPTCVKDALIGLGFGDTRAWASALGRASLDIQEQWNDPPDDKVGSDAQWNFMQNLYSVQQHIVDARWPGKVSFAQPMWGGGSKGNESTGWNPYIGEGPKTCASGSNDSRMRSVIQNLKTKIGGSAYIRLGWEFNGNWYPNQNAWAGASPYSGDYKADWKACWVRWYDIIKSVSADFKVVWNPNWANKGNCWNDTNTNILDYWPGAEFVDAAGPDQYDANCNSRAQDPNARGNFGEPIGIMAWADWVIAQG